MKKVFWMVYILCLSAFMACGAPSNERSTDNQHVTKPPQRQPPKRQPPARREPEKPKCTPNKCKATEHCQAGICLACQPGKTRSCKTAPKACKEGTQFCSTEGKWSACQGEVLPQKESCNGKDDDCNGQIDEGENLCASGSFCDTGKCIKKYPCSSDEHCIQNQYCKEGKYCATIPTCKKHEVFCSRRCVDLNKDMQHCGRCGTTCKTGQTCSKGYCISCKPGTTRSCGSDLGSCQKGTQTCTDRGWGPCQNAVFPKRETCNGQDDNCNGQIDDNVQNLAKPCAIPGKTGGKLCSKTHYVCNAGKLTCEAAYKGKVEQCNGFDDDCDGKIDNASRGSLCAKGCTFPYNVPTANTDYRTGRYYQTDLLLDPETGAICGSKGLSRALQFNVSWDSYHGYITVRFRTGPGWTMHSITAPQGTSSKNFPYGQRDVTAILKSPKGKYFEVFFDWGHGVSVTLRHVKVLNLK